MRWIATFLLLAQFAHANGTLAVRGGSGQVRLTEHRVSATVEDRVAQVTVEQVFQSSAHERLEGVYVFPLPDGATVSDFAMTMGGRLVQGEVLARRKAKRIYEGIVQRKRDPGLLEKVDRGIFRARVFPIEPGKELLIRLAYTQVLPESDGTTELRYPLARDRMQAALLDKVSVRVDIESTAELKTIYCPSHAAQITRKAENAATVALELGRGAQERDFLLYIGRSPDAVGFSLLSHRPAAQKGTFLAVLAPAGKVDDAETLPKDVVYVLDTSGSMQGRKLEQANAALAFGIRNLRPRDRFNVIAFASGVRRWSDILAKPGPHTTESAVEWVKQQEANGPWSGSSSRKRTEARPSTRRSRRRSVWEARIAWGSWSFSRTASRPWGSRIPVGSWSA
jgi:Ca-activated chloride channel family protein